MRRPSTRELQATLAVLGGLGFIAVAVPDVQKMWETRPGDVTVRRQVQLGHSLFLTAAIVLVVLAALAYRSWFIALAGLLFVALRVGFERMALNSPAP